MLQAKSKGDYFMTKLHIDPGPCGFKTLVTAELNDEDLITLKVATGCKSVMQMMEDLGNEFDPYEICIVKPGKGPFFAYASEKFPPHAACPVLGGIIKCMEVENSTLPCRVVRRCSSLNLL